MTWARKLDEFRERKAAEKEAHLRALCEPSMSLHRGTYAGQTTGQAVEKDNSVQHEGYRRLVALLPCKACGIGFLSQCAHPNTGKAAGKKLIDDRLCFPLCADSPGRRGCHPRFDQGALYDKRTRRLLEPAWGAETRQEIRKAGLWPADLPEWEEDRSTA